MNEIEIAAILHVQYRGSAVLHCIILYQNGHSGPKSSEIVSKNIYISMLYGIHVMQRTAFVQIHKYANIFKSIKCRRGLNYECMLKCNKS